jgi:hypothetical protein
MWRGARLCRSTINLSEDSPVSQPRLELRTSLIQVYSFTAASTCSVSNSSNSEFVHKQKVSGGSRDATFSLINSMKARIMT